MAELYEHQKLSIAQLLAGKKIITAGVGLGKGAIAVVWAAKRCAETGKGKILVITTSSKARTGDFESDYKLWNAPDDIMMEVISWHKLKRWVEEHWKTLDEYVVIADECMPADTKVSTDKGEQELASLSVGDKVLSYNHATNELEYKKITRTIKKQSPDVMYRLLLANGTAIISTGNHPHYTQDGYKNAEDIKKGDILYENTRMENSKIRRKRRVWNMWKDNNGKRHNEKPKRQAPYGEKDILFDGVCEESDERKWEESNGECRIKREVKKKSSRKNDYQQPIPRQKNNSQSFGNEKEKWMATNMGRKTRGARRKWKIDRATSKAIRSIRKEEQGLGNGVTGENRGWRRVPKQLQNRCGECVLQDSNRMRRRKSQFCEDKNERQKKRTEIKGIRVESIEVLELGDIKRLGLYRDPDNVYCIDVEDNHNFFANGMLTHNCQRIKGYTTGMGKAFLKIAKRNHDWAGFTGTPGDSWEYFIGYFVATNLARNKTAFLAEFANIQTYKGYPEIVGWRNEDKLRHMWATINYAPDARKALQELPKENYRTITFSKPKTYATVLKTREYEGEFLDTSGALCSRLRQLCFTKEKQQWISDFVDSLETGAIFFYNFVETGNKLEEIIKKALPKGARIWRIDGKHHEIPTAETIGKKDMVLCQWQSGSEALNVQFLHYWVGIELCYSNSMLQQSMGRIKRIGQMHPMWFYRLITEGTIEKDIVRCLSEKKDFSERNWCLSKNLIMKGEE